MTRRMPVFHRRLALLPLVMVLFFSISGGAFGLEDAVGESGAGMTLLLLVLAPVLWLLPQALMVGELTAMMPVEGGYYAWVKRALGPFWGFQEGWWSWLNSFVDMAIYPVLFAEYLSVLLVREFAIDALEENRALRWAVGLVMIWGFTALNVRGIRRVGETSTLFAALVLAPFAVMSAIGIVKLVGEGANVVEPFTPEGTSTLGALGLGLFVVLWNYLGWDGPTTVGGEIEDTRRAYPRAMVYAVPLVIAAYILPVLAGLVATTDPAVWSTGQFPVVADELAGRWLGTWLAVAGMVSAAGLFSALLLANSRLPFVLAADGYLPEGLTRLHPRYETPWRAIVLCSLIYSVFSWSTFENLVVVDVIVYAVALLLEFAALIVLRRTLPDVPRPVRVPGGWAGVWLVSLSPLAVLVLAVAGTLHDEGAGAVVLAALTLASGLAAYPLLRRFVKRGAPDVPVQVIGERTGAA